MKITFETGQKFKSWLRCSLPTDSVVGGWGVANDIQDTTRDTYRVAYDDWIETARESESRGLTVSKVDKTVAIHIAFLVKSHPKQRGQICSRNADVIQLLTYIIHIPSVRAVPEQIRTHDLVRSIEAEIHLRACWRLELVC